MRQEKLVSSPSLPAFVIECMDHATQGWKVDPERIPAQFGFLHECYLIRDASALQIEHDEKEAAKPSRAEILAKARAAKAANKKGAQQ